MIIAAISFVFVIFLVWKLRPRRAAETGFKFVYVNLDGSARELSPAEQAYLSEEFSGGDGGRPYIKISYESRDGWGALSGYIERRRVPSRIKISPVHPGYDDAVKAIAEDFVDMQRAAGDIIVKNPDGSITCTPNPDLSHAERFARARKHQLEQQLRREELAKVT